MANLKAARTLLVGDRRRAAAGLGLFALSPLPSAQLFVAAGLLRVRLVPLTLAFFSGRLISYSLYVGGAEPIDHSSAFPRLGGRTRGFAGEDRLAQAVLLCRDRALGEAPIEDGQGILCTPAVTRMIAG